jgi:hypothetical protein
MIRAHASMLRRNWPTAQPPFVGSYGFESLHQMYPSAGTGPSITSKTSLSRATKRTVACRLGPSRMRTPSPSVPKTSTNSPPTNAFGSPNPDCGGSVAVGVGDWIGVAVAGGVLVGLGMMVKTITGAACEAPPNLVSTSIEPRASRPRKAPARIHNHQRAAN